MSELFDIPESKSPRLQWIEKHCIEISPPIPMMNGALCQWMAFNKPVVGTCYGATEDEAVARLAMQLGIKLWNEEGPK